MKITDKMSKKFVLNIENDTVTIEISLPKEECSIINNELSKEIDYWKGLTLENNENKLELESNAPKRHILIPRKVNETKPVDIDAMMEYLRPAFINNNPDVRKYMVQAPKREDVLSFEEIADTLMKNAETLKEDDNCSLKNKFIFGGWLSLAYKIYRHDKYIKNKKLPNRFEHWLLHNCYIRKQQAMNYRNFNKLAHLAPKLLHCRVSFTYFVKNHEIFTSYLEENITSAWRHELYCKCNVCEQYFSLCI